MVMRIVTPPPQPSPVRGEGANQHPAVSPSPLAGEGRGGGQQSTPASQIQRARILRSNLTDAERHLWRQLRLGNLSGFKFRRQQPIGPYIVDFVCLPARLIIELDGGQHLENLKDRKRDGWLGRQGFRVLRFWNNDVFMNTEAVLAHILGALLLPPTSPAREETAPPNPLTTEDQVGEPQTPSPIAGEGRGGGTDPDGVPTSEEHQP